MRKLLEITIDVVPASDLGEDAEGGHSNLPTLADLRRYEIATMRVSVEGPGGYPAITLGFRTGPAGQDRANALRFLTEWYGSDDPESDLTAAAKPDAD